MLFQRPRLEIATVEDGVVGKAGAMLEAVCLQFHHHFFGFPFVVLVFGDADRVALAEFGPQFFFEEFGVVRNQRVGGLEDAQRRAVILFELDELQIRVIARQAAQVLDVGATPAVNRLIVVAHGGKGGARAGEQFQELVLTGVGVLIFIDQQVTQAVLPLFEDCRMPGEQFHRQRDKIVEIDSLIGFQRGRIAGVGQSGEFFGLVLRCLARLVGRDQRVFPVGNQRLQTADRRFVDAAGEVGKNAEAVTGVENRKPWLVTQNLRFFAQDTHAQRMEGGYGEAGRFLLEQRADALLHFACGLVGEGDRGDGRRIQAAVVDEIGDLLRDHPRLARTGTGQHQQGAIKIADGFALRSVEHGGATVKRER